MNTQSLQAKDIIYAYLSIVRNKTCQHSP